MNEFDLFAREVEDGVQGKNAGIPMGFDRLNSYIGIRKSHNYLIGGYTGSGKTALLDDAFVLNPVDWYITNRHKTDIKLEIVYWSMERRKNFKFAKWISRRIFLDKGIIIPVSRIMGWVKKEERLTHNEHDLISSYRDYIGNLLSVVTIMDGPEHPTAIKMYARERFLANGVEEEIDEHKKVYVPNDYNKILLFIKDHIGLLRKEKGLNTKKEILDKASEDSRYIRDHFGGSVVDVSQFNRDIANPIRIKNGDVEPMLEDFKDTGNTQEDADVIMSLFDPMRYKVPDPSGYDLTKLRDDMGAKKFRSLRILKNSYGPDDRRIGLAFQPEIGMFKEMPKLINTTDQVYRDIIGNQYFLKEYGR